MGRESENKAVKKLEKRDSTRVGSGPLHRQQGGEEVEAPGQDEDGRAVCFDPTLNPKRGAPGVVRFTSVRAKEKKREKNIV